MVEVVARSAEAVTLQLTVPLTGGMLEMEGAIQEALNAAGRLATEEALSRFDTNGSPIRLGDVKWTARARDPKEYESPYGPVRVERYVYQSPKGGRIYCPLEQDARIIGSATPQFARQLSHKYAQLNVRAVQRDLDENHGRAVAASYIQNVAEWVGSIAMAQEEAWTYEIPQLNVAVATIVASLDGTMIPMAEGGYREAMVGSLSLYDLDGTRVYSIYLGAAPEYGKETFKQRMEREIARLKEHFPQAQWIGIADGAASNWAFLERHTERQLIDFFHAAEYVGKLAHAAYPQAAGADKRAHWRAEHCSLLKHDPTAIEQLIAEGRRLSQRPRLSAKVRDELESALTYFDNHRHHMDYPGFLADNLPIGSGVTEAACKTLVKQRLCGSGMRWKDTGAKVVLSLRALTQTLGRWSQFWHKIHQFGAECRS